LSAAENRPMCTRFVMLLLISGLSGISPLALAQLEPAQEAKPGDDAVALNEEEQHREDDDLPERSSWRYGKKGLEFDPEGPTALWLGFRLQTRLDTFPTSPVAAQDLRLDVDTELELNRARIKGGGTLFFDWLDVYFEYDQQIPALLDLRTTLKFGNGLALRLGQWKSDFNRERIDSSGNMQLVERSLSNYWFAIDRQPGIALSGRLAKGSAADASWWLEYLSGMGRGGGTESDSGLWLARYQWNPQGQPLPFSQGDLVRRQTPLGSIAVAVVDGKTPYTRFAGSGGGQLPGWDYASHDLRQYLFETAVHYRGLSWQQEYHVKKLRDRSTGRARTYRGGYIQVGSFLNEWFNAIPPELEFAGRLSLVDPDEVGGDDMQREFTLGANWFFNGHRNKLTVEYAWLSFDSAAGSADKNRFRLQWEVSL